MSSRYARAEAITLERLDEIFGHETAHLERWQQYAIAAKCFMHFADIVGEIAIEMNSARPTQETRERPACDGCGEPATDRCPYCQTTSCDQCSNCEHRSAKSHR